MPSTYQQREPVERQEIFLQLVTTPTADTPGTTLLLHLPKQRYLFGHLAEGTQRACIERSVGLKKLSNIFLTGETKWANNGGLIGLLLTLADIQAEDEVNGKRQQLHIHGGPKLWHTVACARRFVFRTGMPLKVCEKNADQGVQSALPDYQDDNIDVWSIAARGDRRVQKNENKRFNRSNSPTTLDEEQKLRAKTVHDMFDSDWKLDRLVETPFKDVIFPAMVWTRNPESKEMHATFCTKVEDAAHIELDQLVLVRTPWPAALVTELPPADNLPSAVSVSYLVKARPQRGKFNAKKAKELGVPPGRLNGVLASGQSVTLDDGRTIQPDDVIGSPDQGRGTAILDIPDPSYIEDVVSQLSQLQSDKVVDGVEVMFWLLGQGVVDSAEFKAACAHFASFKHVISSPETAPNTFAMDSSAAASVRLSQARPECYLVPRHNNQPLEGSQNINIDNVVIAQRGLTVQIAPGLSVSRSEIPENVDVENIGKTCRSDIATLLPEKEEQQIDVPFYDNVQLTTLGTGSAAPSKYRNVSSNLLFIPELGYTLFDVGEGTLGQLRRINTPDELDRVLCELRLIWISHLHADHHLGTNSILAERKKAIQRRKEKGIDVVQPIYLIAEKNMVDFLSDYSSVESSECVLLRVANSKLNDILWNPVNIRDTALPIKDLQTCMVKHCHGAQAVSITFSNGFKISYSGDCRPSYKFAEIGVNSDILIHEATFDDGLEGDAKAKRHCTTGEALGVAVAMKAKNVVLTHFSQRYQKLPVLNNIKFAGQLDFEEGDETGDNDEPVDGDLPARTLRAEEEDMKHNTSSTLQGDGSATMLQKAAEEMNICVAFDLMRVNVSQIKDMHQYYPAIERIFEIEQGKRDVERAMKRELNTNSLNKKKVTQERPQRTVNAQNSKYESDSRFQPRSKKETSANGPTDDSGLGAQPDDGQMLARQANIDDADEAKQVEMIEEQQATNDQDKDSLQPSQATSKRSLKRLARKGKHVTHSTSTQEQEPKDSRKKLKLNDDHL